MDDSIQIVVIQLTLLYFLSEDLKNLVFSSIQSSDWTTTLLNCSLILQNLSSSIAELSSRLTSFSNDTMLKSVWVSMRKGTTEIGWCSDRRWKNVGLQC